MYTSITNDNNPSNTNNSNKAKNSQGQDNKKQQDMFRIPKGKRNNFPMYLDEERDDFFIGCTFEDQLESVGNRELAHLQVIFLHSEKISNLV